MKLGSSEFSDGKPTVLADAPGYRITLHRGDGSHNILVITFGTMLSGLSDEGFGTAFAKRRKYDHIYVAQEFGSWYQKLSFEEFATVVSGLTQPYERVYTYGSSLGGYAALYYAGAIDARAVSAAPINWAHPKMKSKKWSQVRYLHKDLRDVPRPSKSPVVLYDPTRPSDEYFVNEFVAPAVPHKSIIELPYSGHAILFALKENRLLKEFLVQIFEFDRLVDLSLKREGSYVWHLHYGEERLRFGEPSLAELHFKRSLGIQFNRIAAKRLASLLSSQGRSEDLNWLAERGRQELGNTKFMDVIGEGVGEWEEEEL